ncbi:MAG: putative transport system ATP-binding protein, partial [Streptomyces sp.]|nr:putative transport system ATP-binding protein [Streptomyces sp.]
MGGGIREKHGAMVGNESAADGGMVVVEDLVRTYGSGDTAVHAVRGVSFTVPRGELVALKGRSGSGKTTL